MSNPVSALQGKAYSGYVEIEEAGLRGMITLRGDLSDAKLRKAIEAVAGCKMPGIGACNFKGEMALGWMSPDELLLMLPYPKAEATAAKMAKTLAKSHALVANVSDARAVFHIHGSRVRETIAKLAPVDTSPERFQPGQIRRTRLAQVPAAFWMRNPETLELICFRSVAGYVFDLLSNAAQSGSEI